MIYLHCVLGLKACRCSKPIQCCLKIQLRSLFVDTLPFVEERSEFHLNERHGSRLYDDPAFPDFISDPGTNLTTPDNIQIENEGAKGLYVKLPCIGPKYIQIGDSQYENTRRPLDIPLLPLSNLITTKNQDMNPDFVPTSAIEIIRSGIGLE